MLTAAPTGPRSPFPQGMAERAHIYGVWLTLTNRGHMKPLLFPLPQAIVLFLSTMSLSTRIAGLPRVFGAGIFAVQAAWRGDGESRWEPHWGEEKHERKRQRDHLYDGGDAYKVWTRSLGRGWVGDQPLGREPGDGRLGPGCCRGWYNAAHPGADRGRGYRGRGLGQGAGRAHGELLSGGGGLCKRGGVRRVRGGRRRDEH